jgi:hypothetical protein
MSLLIESVLELYLRDLDALRKEVEAYADESDLWVVLPGTINSAGVLVHHCAGNLRHYVGALLGKSGYVRDRDAEFARRDIPRRELLEMIAAAEREVAAALTALPAASLDLDFPEPIRGAIRKTGDHLIRLTSHLGYHLGQVNYHRRVTTAGRESRVEGRA